MLEEMRNKTPESVFLSRMKVLMEHSGNDLQKVTENFLSGLISKKY
jgi:hypothetical protein